MTVDQALNELSPEQVRELNRKIVKSIVKKTLITTGIVIATAVVASLVTDKLSKPDYDESE